jgi:predicted nucleotidyltransferase
LDILSYLTFKATWNPAIGLKVDLVTPQAVSKYFRDQVLAQAELVYEG